MSDRPLDSNFEQRETQRALCLILFKPSGMLIQDEIMRIIKEHANIVLDKNVFTTQDKVTVHYNAVQYDRQGQPTYFYPALVRYMSNRELRALIIEAKTSMNPDEFVRYIKEEVVGNKEHGIPQYASPGQVRYLGVVHGLEHDQHVDMSDMYDQLPESWHNSPRRETIIDNLIHSSSNASEALQEIRIWFGQEVLDSLTNPSSNISDGIVES